MYFALLVLMLGLSAWLASSGYARRRRAQIVLGGLLALATVAFFGFMSFWGEALWYAALGYARRFWFILSVQLGGAIVVAALATAITYALLTPFRRSSAPFGRWPLLVAALGGAALGAGAWQDIVMFVYRQPAGFSEPILGADAGFYLFTLPFLDLLQDLALMAAVVTAGYALAVMLAPTPDGGPPLATRRDATVFDRAIGVASVALAVAVGIDLALTPFHLLYSDEGLVTGPGWSDVHLRIPGYWVLAAAIPVIVAAAALHPVRRRAFASLASHAPELRSPALFAAGAAWLAAGVLWLVVVGVVPWLAQSLYVEPNEITLERPYIAHNIEFTRRGFNLHDIEERQYPISAGITPATLEQNEPLLSEVRLWDWRALDAVYKQFQEIRLYYEFQDVDIDRYDLGDDYRQVMVSARELEIANLPPGSQTFVNERFKYTHGYGITLATVSDFTPSGLPNLLIKDIPPVAEHPSLEVTRPEIYYGELTRQPVVANSAEPEFDYPSGDENLYTRYEGNGGVRIGGLWRKFLFGWKFDGTELLFSTYPQPDSRMMFYREIRSRAQRLAPFLRFDEDPYIVLADGRLYWILDAYTMSSRLPYSTRFDLPSLSPGVRGLQNGTVNDLQGANYLRNSVKVVIDAYEGSVDFYVFEPNDPIIEMWQAALPNMFQPADAMPESLRRHVRYPQGMLLTQGLVYATYHMSDPTVFYNQEDLWVRATEKHYDRIEPVEPYYVMWQLPESNEAEFVMMLPFTPKDRQVLIGWIAGLSDGDNYGRFIAYKFPKERRVLGPQQVETKIDQDRFLSGQLTLWDQRGSNVIRGNVLAIPIDGNLLYVEPIYLEAETAAYPELRVVVTMQGDNMSYGDSFAEAIDGLLGDDGNAATESAAAASTYSSSELALEANDAFEGYLEAVGNGDFAAAAAALEDLRTALREMVAAEPPEPAP